jgi:hypothetical protein
MNTQENLDRFHAELAKQYTRLFETPSYALAARLNTPEGLARKMALGLDNGTANKDGEGIKAACKALKIPHTYKAIRTFLNEK